MKRPPSRRRFIGTLGALGISLAAPSALRAANEPAYTMRLALSQTAVSPLGRAALRFATGVRRRTNGQVNVEVYPDNQLVSQQGTGDALINGVIDFGTQGSNIFSPLVPQLAVFDLPFLFKNAAAAFRVLDGPVGTDFFAKLEEKGLVGLGWGYAGFRELETSKTVVVPEDMRGLRIRNTGGAVGSATLQALGAIPVAIDLTEALTAFSQHTVDGVDLPIPTFVAQRFYTVCKHIAMSHHVFSPQPLVGSKRKLEALPASIQRIIKEEARAVVPWWRAAIAEDTAASTQILKQNGVAFTDPQYPAFRKAVEPVYALFQSRYGGDILERVVRASG